MPPKNFADRLADSVRQKKSVVLVGLDPRWVQLPPVWRDAQASRPSIAAQARAFSEFCREIIDCIAPLACAVKPQAACFEQLGPAGMTALAETITHARLRGLPVILDGKRNDIGATATLYAQGYLGEVGESAWGADALTVSPYLGEDSLQPFVEVANARGAGIFTLVKTSNPGGGKFQDLVCEGAPLYRHVAKYVEEEAAKNLGECGFGQMGAVVGATYPQQLAELRTAMPHAWLLIPGYGSQGGTAADVASAFDERGLGAIVNNSRGIIFAHENTKYADAARKHGWLGAVEAATRDMRADLAQYTQGLA